MSPEHKTELLDAGKLSSLWAAVGISTWSEFAAFAAAIYSVLLILDLCWRRVVRPLAERRGWINPKVTKEKDDEAD